VVLENLHQLGILSDAQINVMAALLGQLMMLEHLHQLGILSDAQKDSMAAPIQQKLKDLMK